MSNTSKRKRTITDNDGRYESKLAMTFTVQSDKPLTKGLLSMLKEKVQTSLVSDVYDSATKSDDIVYVYAEPGPYHGDFKVSITSVKDRGKRW